MTDIIDLHCDLLSYLRRDGKHTPYDERVRCAVPQLRAGGVGVQTLAIFSTTGDGSQGRGQRQIEIFEALPERYPEAFRLLGSQRQGEEIQIVAAIENASAFCGEDEDLDSGIARLQRWKDRLGRVAYVSLTWNDENRFGGGAMSSCGLKDDGRLLIEVLAEEDIAVDLSHASDALARDIIGEVDRRGLQVPLIASHSNMRAVTDVPRNLPDDIAREVIARKGVIGLALVRTLVGDDDPYGVVRHLERVLALGGERSVCLGADFFDDGEMPAGYAKPGGWFFSEYPDASCYPCLVALWKEKLGLQKEVVDAITHGNAERFLSS